MYLQRVMPHYTAVFFLIDGVSPLLQHDFVWLIDHDLKSLFVHQCLGFYCMTAVEELQGKHAVAVNPL